MATIVIVIGYVITVLIGIMAMLYLSYLVIVITPRVILHIPISNKSYNIRDCLSYWFGTSPQG